MNGPLTGDGAGAFLIVAWGVIYSEMNLDAHGWKEATFTMAVELTACTHHPGKVFPYPLSALDAGPQSMPGIKAAYVSGYAQATLLTPQISAIGGFVVEREDKGKGKGYVFEFIMDDKGSVYFRGLDKPYSGHHFDTLSGIDVGTLFENLKGH